MLFTIASAASRMLCKHEQDREHDHFPEYVYIACLLSD